MIFKLITHLPDTVTKWVGQQVQNLGEEGAEQRTRAIFTGAMSKMEGAGNAIARGGGGPKSVGGGDNKGESNQNSINEQALVPETKGNE